MDTQNEKIISGPKFSTSIPECSLGEFLLPRIKSLPKNAVTQVDSENGSTRTFGELFKTSAGLAQGLLNIGFKENDVVATVTKNRHELYPAALAVIWAGGCVASVDRAMTIYELKHMFGIVHPKYIFCEEDVLENIEKALGLLGVDAQIILFDSSQDNGVSYLTFEKLITDVDVESFRPRPIKSPSSELSFIMSSSGSTGLPKGVGLSHRNIIFQLVTCKFKKKPLSEMPSLQMPQFFWMSQALTFLFSVMTGMKRILIKNPTAENLLKAIHTYKPAWGMFAPSTLTSLMNHPDFKEYDVSSVKVMQPVGAIITERLINRVKKEWGQEVMIQQVFGITELSGVITEADPSANVLSVGKLGPGVQLKILDVQTKKPLGPNQTGELCFKSEGVMKCYVRNPEATKEVIDNEGWFRTGDLGYYDDNEYLYVVDRIKEIIKVQNMHVSPQELENLIETLPGVAEVGVVGIPNEKDMNHPMALVVKKKESDISEDYIIEFVKENLSDCKQLRGGVKFVPLIPRTRTGKIKRKELKELAESLYKN